MAQSIEKNPFERLSTDTLDARLGRETQAKGMGGGKQRRRTSRPDQIALKTSPLKRQQFDRLSLRLGKSKVETFEAALDALEEKLNAEPKGARR
jgi:hypothetical protein